MIAGLLAMAVANAAAVQGARALLGRVRTGDPALDATLFLLLRLLLVSAAVLAAGLAGTLHPWALAAAGAAALAVLWRLPGEHRAIPRLGPIPRPLAAVVAVLALRFLLQTWFLSPFDGDALSYHLPKVAEWVRAGGFTRALGGDPLVTLPAGFELVETWWVVFLRHDALIELAGVEFAALGACAAWALARRAGLPDAVAPWAGVLYALTPGVLLQAVACLNDAPVASLVAAAFALAAARAHPLLLALPVLLGAGVKGSALYALPGVALLAFLERKAAPLPRPPLPVAGALAGLALAVGSFWYLRNLAWFGNPVHPVTASGFDLDFVRIQAGPSAESLLSNAARYFGDYLPDRDWVYGSSLRQASGWGAAGFGFGGVALLAACRADRRWRVWTASFAASLASVFACVATDGWFGRFALFTAALLAPALAALGARSRLLAGALAAGAVLQFGLTLVPGNLGGPWAAELARQPAATRSLGPVLGFERPAGRIGLWNDRRTMEYLLYGPAFSHEVVLLRPSGPEALPDELRRAGVDVVLVQLRAPWAYDALDRLAERGLLRRLPNRYYRLP